MLRLVPTSTAMGLLAAAASLLLSSSSAESQARFVYGDTWMPYGRDWDEERSRRRRGQASAPTTSGSAYTRQQGSTSATVRSAPKPRTISRPSNDDDGDDKPAVATGPKLLEGGPRPDISPMRPSPVSMSLGQPTGTVVIDTKGRALYLVTGSDSALRYPISVGREGFTWTGTEKISRIADWPDWHPPAEMRERDPRLPEKMTGGVRNPLGAKSLYLGNSLYRIHGTNDAKTIGYAASSGCFRMMNGHVIDLAGRIGIGTKVVVLQYLGAKPVASSAPATTSGSSKPQTASSALRRSS